MSADAVLTVPGRATRKEWLGLGVIAIPCLLYSMDLTVLNLAVPSLSADLRPTSAQLLWIVDIYGFLIAGSLITMGTLGDRIGRRRLLLIGAAAFGAASVLAALSSSAGMLIVSRALLGIAAATLAPSTLSLIRNMFHDPAERTTAIGIWVASFSTGAAIGPLIGGALLARFWWGSVFLINVPLMLLLIAFGPMLLPEFKDPSARRLDLVSAALSMAAVLFIIFGVKEVAAAGEIGPALIAVLVGAAIGAVFLRRQAHLEHPLIEFALFRSHAFVTALALGVIAFFVNFGTFFLLAQYLQLGLGFDPFTAGLWTVPGALGFIAGSIVAPRAVARTRPVWVVAAGFVIAAVGLVTLTLVQAGTGLAVVTIASVILSFGLAPVVILATDLVVGAVPPERAGSASALSETSAELGGALGIAMLGSIVTAIYRSRMAQAPSEVPSEASDTLGAAIAIARSSSEEEGALLLDVAREAFTSGLHVAAATSAAIAFVAAIAALIGLRQRG